MNINNKPKSLIEFIQSKPLWECTLIHKFTENTSITPLLNFLTKKTALRQQSRTVEVRSVQQRWNQYNKRLKPRLWTDRVDVLIS